MKLKIKRRYYYLITFSLIFFCTIFLLNFYSKRWGIKLNKIATITFEQEINNGLTNISRDVIGPKVIDEVLVIQKNKDGEILYVDYNLNNTYQLLDEVTDSIKNYLKKKAYPNEGIILKLPFLVESNNVFLNNIGPKITINITFIDSILTNIYSKITNYGLNNALVEAYIKISITGQIITPVSKDEKRVDYDMLIASKVINGRVPLYYGGIINANSSILDIPFKS